MSLLHILHSQFLSQTKAWSSNCIEYFLIWCFWDAYKQQEVSSFGVIEQLCIVATVCGHLFSSPSEQVKLPFCQPTYSMLLVFIDSEKTATGPSPAVYVTITAGYFRFFFGVHSFNLTTITASLEAKRFLLYLSKFEPFLATVYYKTCWR